MRRVLNQAANAAVKAKGTIFSVVYRRIIPRLGHAYAGPNTSAPVGLYPSTTENQARDAAM